MRKARPFTGRTFAAILSTGAVTNELMLQATLQNSLLRGPVEALYPTCSKRAPRSGARLARYMLALLS